VALARELGVSDTLIRTVRRGEIWNGRPGKPNRNDGQGDLRIRSRLEGAPQRGLRTNYEQRDSKRSRAMDSPLADS
jgi:hypothetical protein